MREVICLVPLQFPVQIQAEAQLLEVLVYGLDERWMSRDFENGRSSIALDAVSDRNADSPSHPDQPFLGALAYCEGS